MPTIAIFVSINILSLSQCNQIEKRIKGNQIEKEEVKKHLLFADVMILYIEKP